MSQPAGKSLRGMWVATLILISLVGCSSPTTERREKPSSEVKPAVNDPTAQVHYLEIVCDKVDEQCATLERLHGISFGPKVADLGQARVAKGPAGNLIGVRAPLAKHEQPIVRAYVAVEDIKKAVKDAEAAGATIAYPPTQQGDTGTWAIYVVGDLQFGLWQR